jgi:hypothetical protein
MGHNLSVYVLDSEGDPVEGTEVRIDIEGIWKGGTLEEYTDDDGHAEFETADDYEPSRKLMIYVRDESFGPYEIEGGAYTVQLD